VPDIMRSKKYRIDPAILDGVKVPLLILDPVWLAYFRRTSDEKIKALQGEVKDYLKEIAKVNETREAMVKRKRECMTRILSLTSEAHGNGDDEAKGQIGKDNQAIQRLNQELEKQDIRAEKLPGLLEQANKRLLFETVSTYYVKMREKRERLAEVNPQIDKLRERLRALTDEKLAGEEEIEKTYNLLHGLIGGELIDKLDAIFENGTTDA
ncbi:MAG: hypothetical protein FWF44_06140, partial [Defluviitaleaceae bacterium]|nr:hypothetical protein [Defluviitaleaceae bacterium]